MMRDYFIDEKGRIFKTQSLHKAAEKIPVTIYHIDREANMKELVMWQIENFRDFIVHFRRVSEADLTVPLIVRSDGYIMDGWHRITKALLDGKEDLPQKRFAIDPEPDEQMK